MLRVTQQVRAHLQEPQVAIVHDLCHRAVIHSAERARRVTGLEVQRAALPVQPQCANKRFQRVCDTEAAGELAGGVEHCHAENVLAAQHLYAFDGVGGAWFACVRDCCLSGLSRGMKAWVWCERPLLSQACGKLGAAVNEAAIQQTC